MTPVPDDAVPMAGSIPAATLVVFRRGASGGAPELLMQQRADHMRFAGGKTVFPGGRIDPADRELAARLSPETANAATSDQAAARVAAIRETLEETGLVVGLERGVSAEEARAARAALFAEGALAPVLQRFGWRLALETLIPFARWCPNFPKAFDTHFFIADIGTGAVEIASDNTETTRLFWASAADTLAMAERDEVSVIFPTQRNLERLARFASFAEAAAECRAIPPRLISPWAETRAGGEHLCIPEDAGYPVTAVPMAAAERGFGPFNPPRRP